jgi:predicted GIY-YIG superfamily endonuclease
MPAMPYRAKCPCVCIFGERAQRHGLYRREKQMKEWRRRWKIRLIESMNPEWIDLFDERTGEILDGPADLSRRTR